ncbi:MAG: iron ABC transporter permease, partial [Deltaproteobacteria bacterium]|nr:iron ABC transporter permease [Deltaproteobacteria bacterium]
MIRYLSLHSFYGKAKKTRTGKLNLVRQEHSYSIWKKTIFLTGLGTLLVLSSGYIVTLGQVPMNISDVYSTL